MDFAVQACLREKWKKKENKYLNLVSELKKTTPVEHESDGESNYHWRSWYSHQSIDTGTGGLGNKRAGVDLQNYGIIKIGLDTEENPVDLRRLVVIQTPVRNHQLTLAWKTRKGVINNDTSKGYVMIVAKQYII